MSDVFDPNKSYFTHNTGETCGICNNKLSHPPIILPVGRVFTDEASKSVQATEPLLKFPTVRVCYGCALELLAPLEEHDPNHPNEGKWYREWMTGGFEPLILSNAIGEANASRDDNSKE